MVCRTVELADNGQCVLPLKCNCETFPCGVESINLPSQFSTLTHFEYTAKMILNLVILHSAVVEICVCFDQTAEEVGDKKTEGQNQEVTREFEVVARRRPVAPGTVTRNSFVLG
jgi:hypothetical protein